MVTFKLISLKQITTGSELNTIAHRHRNCLIQVRFKIDLASGKRIFLLYHEGAGENAVEAVAALIAEPDSVLWLDECVLSNRRSAGRAVRERIVQLLSEAGIQAGVRSFQQAWDTFTGRDAMPHIEDLWDMTWAEQ